MPKLATSRSRSRRGEEASPLILAPKDLFFTVRDKPTNEVIEILSQGSAAVPDPAVRQEGRLQDLPFFAAARSPQLGGADRIMRMLVETVGCNPCSVDQFWQTPLFYAAREGNVQCARYLLKAGCEANRRDYGGQTPIFYSVARGHHELTGLLIEFGADLEIKDRNGLTPKQHREAGRPKTTAAASAALLAYRAARREAAPPRRLHPATKVKDSRSQSSPRLKSKRAAMAAWAAGSLKSPSHDGNSKAPAGKFKGKQTDPAGYQFDTKSALLEQGAYSICFPTVADAVRLRELEREFVLEHAELCQNESWFDQLSATEWCGFVNVILEEGAALQAIRTIILGGIPQHATMCCVHTENHVRTVVGYVHVVKYPDTLDVSHLKVCKKHQGRGLGGFLMAGAGRAADRLDWPYDKLKLVVLQRNQRAMSLYKKLGFGHSGTTLKPVKPGSDTNENWESMKLQLGGKAQDFERACCKRVRQA